MDGDTKIFESDPAQIEENRRRVTSETASTPVSLYISVCSGRGWHGQFGYCLASLMMSLGYSLGDTMSRAEQGLAPRDRIVKVNLAFARQANIVASRNDHILAAIREGYTHFLSLDDDMTFPTLAVHRLLEHGKPLIAANYRKKTAERVECVCAGLDGSHLSSVGKTGIERIKGFGMGLTLIDLAAIKHVPAPYFAVIWNKTHQIFMIEDCIFSNLLAEHGVEAWVDHDLSRDVGHVGDYEYRL